MNKKIIEILKEEKRRQKLSNVQIAKELGCTTRTIYYWLTGERSISIEKADELLKILGRNIVIGNRREN